MERPPERWRGAAKQWSDRNGGVLSPDAVMGVWQRNPLFSPDGVYGEPEMPRPAPSGSRDPIGPAMPNGETDGWKLFALVSFVGALGFLAFKLL